jgi:hypothetical protein
MPVRNLSILHFSCGKTPGGLERILRSDYNPNIKESDLRTDSKHPRSGGWARRGQPRIEEASLYFLSRFRTDPPVGFLDIPVLGLGRGCTIRGLG